MDYDELRRIVKWWIPKLKLEAWEIEVTEDQDAFVGGVEQSHAEAHTERSKDYDLATISFNKTLLENWDNKTANRNVVHELLHLVTREVELIMDLLETQLHRDVESVILYAHRHAVEGAVDRLAARFVEMANVED